MPHGQTESVGIVFAVICWARAPGDGVTRFVGDIVAFIILNSYFHTRTRARAHTHTHTQGSDDQEGSGNDVGGWSDA